MGRRDVRENVFKLVYETGVCGEVNELTVSEATQNASVEEKKYSDIVFKGIDKDDKKYFDKVFYGIVDNKEELEGIIKKYARAYEFSRLYKVDRAILLVAIYEILNLDDIPYKVSVNEAVELAKAYSTEKSASYINGILASVIRDMEALK
ncbi:MAG: transcription antitermination factor NusB [Clostridiales bacterium]|nr:transcription antitermination factor NusB [Clostridiales bacterium]